MYLGFCREDENIGFTALTFGLLTALILFTKFAMPLLRFWQDKGTNICVFLEDRVGTLKTHSTMQSPSWKVRDILK